MCSMYTATQLDKLMRDIDPYGYAESLSNYGSKHSQRIATREMLSSDDGIRTTVEELTGYLECYDVEDTEFNSIAKMINRLTKMIGENRS